MRDCEVVGGKPVAVAERGLLTVSDEAWSLAVRRAEVIGRLSHFPYDLVRDSRRAHDAWHPAWLRYRIVPIRTSMKTIRCLAIQAPDAAR